MKLLLIGAGGHARVVHDALSAAGLELFAYVDPRPSPWLDAPHCTSDKAASELPPEIGVALGLGGVAPAQLAQRLSLLRRYLATGRGAPPIIHPRASVAADAAIGQGAQIMTGAIVQGGVTLDDAVIVNTGAIVEHGSAIGPGTHVAPGAIILGDVRIGACAMIGAGAIVLPGAAISDGALVPAGAVHRAVARGNARAPSARGGNRPARRQARPRP